ncbi:MAG: hypothetical protein ACXQTI_04705 [Candidatus Nezhaarchaeales archaeon]
MLSFDKRLNIAKRIMEDFARLTGLLSNERQERYLWTDAFAIFNFIGLYVLTREEDFRKLALLLVDRVHHVLGKHRGDDGRSGWISGLSDDEAEDHPTIGGLRIGKRLPERRPDEPYDPILEWERDGQYYHYLTKWMLALCRVYQAVNDLRYLRWSVELAKTIHKAFVYTSDVDGRKHIYWKMSIDLSRPLVPQEGQHDALDGLATYAELQLAVQNTQANLPSLNTELLDVLEMCKERDWSDWVTDDPLGIGELLCTSYRLAKLTLKGMEKLAPLINPVLEASYVSLRACLPKDFIYLPASSRLAFRELGLAIGLHAIEKLKNMSEKLAIPQSLLEGILKFMPLANRIEEFWLNPKNQEANSWLMHRNINMVMLATSLIPNGYLGINQEIEDNKS